MSLSNSASLTPACSGTPSSGDDAVDHMVSRHPSPPSPGSQYPSSYHRRLSGRHSYPNPPDCKVSPDFHLHPRSKALGARPTVRYSPSTTPRPTSRPSTGCRGSIPAVPAFTSACWSRSRSTEPSFWPGSMWVKTRYRAGLHPSASPAGPGSVLFGQISYGSTY